MVITASILGTAALAVVLAIALGVGHGEKAEKPEGDSQEEIMETYEEVKEQAEKAMQEMEDLSTEEATSHPETYEQDLQEAEEAFDELYRELEQATDYTVELGEEYMELYDYIWDYYDYLYDLTEQAAQEIDYLLALVPSLDQIQGLEETVKRLENLPKGGKLGELSTQLTKYAQQALSGVQSAKPPASMGASGEELTALFEELQSLAQKTAQSLAGGNTSAIQSLADEITSTIADIEGQLSSAAASLISSYEAVVGQLEAAIESALP